MKENLPYFSHDNNAHRHPKMKALIAEYGYEGYGRFWVLNERIAESPGAYIDISRKVNKLDLAQELGMSGQKLDEFLTFLSDPEIDLINFENGRITTDRITENFEFTREKLNKDRNRKGDKNGYKEIPAENTDFPAENEEIPLENEEIPAENDTNETKLNQTKLNETKPDSSAPDEKGLTDPQKLFLHIWQTTPGTFNSLARIESPKEWARFWSIGPPSCEEVKRVMQNVIDDVNCGSIERRYIPKTPDRFVLGGGFTRHQTRYKRDTKKTSPPLQKPKKSL